MQKVINYKKKQVLQDLKFLNLIAQNVFITTILYGIFCVPLNYCYLLPKSQLRFLGNDREKLQEKKQKFSVIKVHYSDLACLCIQNC